MKKLVVFSTLTLAILTSCAIQKPSTTASNDDVYANPKEDRIADAQIKEEKRLQQVARDKRYNDSIAAIAQAQKEKDDANPYYKEREFNYDDYYDYEYATRLKRFDRNINGLSYYDNYYTNSYFYSGNPYNYGVSVYNGYSWWGSSYNNYSYNPSVSFYSSWGWGYGNQFNSGYNGYNPYMAGYSAGYNNGFNNGMYGNYYGYGSPYGGYGNPYGGYGSTFGFGSNYGYGGYYGDPYGYGGYGYNNNPYNNGWGYYNGYDRNSSYSYGPRSSHGGGNSGRTSNAGVGGREESQKFIRSMADQQSQTTKFSEVVPRTTTSDRPIRVNSAGTPIGGAEAQPVREYTPVGGNGLNNAPTRQPVKVNDGMDPVRQPNLTTPVRSGDPVINAPTRDYPTIKNNPVISQPNATPRNDVPVRQNPVRTIEPTRDPIQRFETPRNEMPRQNNNTIQSPSSPSNNGGGNSSPGGGNGGGHRPR